MLKHYGVYLNPNNPEDAALMEFLDPHARTRRAGDMIRRALLQMIQQPPSYPVPAIPPRPVWTPPPQVTQPATVTRVVESPQPDLMQKARKAFLK